MFISLNALTYIGLLLSGTHIYLMNTFPVEYHSFLIKTTIFCIHVYTNIEHTIIKVINYLKKHKHVKTFNKFIEDNFHSDKGDVDIIKFNIPIITTTKEKLMYSLPVLYDFFIYSSKNAETNIVDKVVFYDVPRDFNYSPCKYSFISSQVTINNVTYQIKFLNDKCNYLIINNKINKLLIAHILKEQFGLHHDEITLKYNLDIIDNDVNVFSLDETQELVLEESKLTITNYEYIER